MPRLETLLHSMQGSLLPAGSSVKMDELIFLKFIWRGKEPRTFKVIF